MTTLLAGVYELFEVIGRGANGVVHRARHRELDREVAVKLLMPHLLAEPGALRRFRREGQAAARLQHPCIAGVTDFGHDGETPFIVMELVPGKSLGAWLREQSAPPPLPVVVEVVDQILDALAAAHTAGVIHRDLKPDNVLLASVGPPLRVKVVDFGLAHLVAPPDGGDTLTRRDAVAGTPAYMSPEQCRSLAVTEAADLYAVGCLLTELLQLAPPFEAATPIDLIAKQLYLPPPPLERPATAAPVPELMERLRLALLAKLPHQRPRGATEARELLARAADADASRARWPDRQGNGPLGTRAERAGDALSRGEGTPDEAAPAAGAWGIVALGPGHGVDDELVVGLAAHGIHLRRSSVEAPRLADASLVLLDVGAELENAPSLVARLIAARDAPPLVVAAAEVPTALLTRLIEAGAADVVRYPLTAARLAPQLRRLLAR